VGPESQAKKDYWYWKDAIPEDGIEAIQERIQGKYCGQEKGG